MSNMIFRVSIFFIVALFIPLSSLAQAQEVPKKSLSQLLKEVKQSKGDARRKAMNSLKLKLRTVNAETRAKTMQELRHAFRGPHIQTSVASTHTKPSIPHQQIQQKMNQQHMINAPHQSHPGTSMHNSITSTMQNKPNTPQPQIPQQMVTVPNQTNSVIQAPSVVPPQVVSPTVSAKPSVPIQPSPGGHR
jgi:hypothetical protein